MDVSIFQTDAVIRGACEPSHKELPERLDRGDLPRARPSVDGAPERTGLVVRAFGAVRFNALQRPARQGRQDGRGGRAGHWFESLAGDARVAVRGLRRDVWFSLGIVATVCATLAANVTLVAFLNGYFGKPLPIARAADHVEVAGRDASGRTNGAWSSAEARRLVEGAGATLDLPYGVAERRASVVPEGASEPQPAIGAVATRAYFTLVPPRLAMGRLPFDEALLRDEVAGVVLSDAGWRRLTANRADILGRTLRIDGGTFVVTGVMAPQVTGLEPITPDFWVLADTYEALVQPLDRGYIVGGLLRENTSAAAASEALTGVVRSLPPRGPSRAQPARAVVRSRTTLIRERADLAPLILILLASFALMTLVACANLSGISHARTAGRARDFSIRFALGASRARVVSQVFMESLVLAGTGGVLACAAAWLVVERLQGHIFSIAIDAGLTLAPVTVDSAVCLYTMLLAIVVGGAFAVTPARAALSAQAASRNHTLVGGRGRSQRTLRRLVVIQAAVSVMLLLVAGIVVGNATRVHRVEAGYNLAPLVDLAFERLTSARVEQFLHDPRVRAATTVGNTPLAGQLPRVTVRSDGQFRRVRHNAVDHRFFETLGIPILRGRGFTAADASKAAGRVIVSASAARLLWPDQDPVGRQLDVDVSETETAAWVRHEVVGVAADALAGFFFEGSDIPVLYLPAGVASARTQQLVARVAGHETTAQDLRALCRAYDPDVLCRATPLETLLDRQEVPFTVAAEIASGLGGITLVLACIGLYGLVSFSVIRQTRDIGIRMALGAMPRTVLAGVLRDATRSLLYGAGFGVPAAIAGLAWLESQVPMIDTFDAAAFVAVPALLLAAGVVTAFVPARRAASLDPLVALRHDGE